MNGINKLTFIVSLSRMGNCPFGCFNERFKKVAIRQLIISTKAALNHALVSC